MRSYILYFDGGDNIRYIKRYITKKPEGREELPNNVASSYVLWLMLKLADKYVGKKANDQTVLTVPTSNGNTGSKYVVDLYPSPERSSDTINVGDRTLVFTYKYKS